MMFVVSWHICQETDAENNEDTAGVGFSQVTFYNDSVVALLLLGLVEAKFKLVGLNGFTIADNDMELKDDWVPLLQDSIRGI